MTENNILAVDTSGKTLAAAILKNETIIGEINENTGLTHSETLLPKVIEMFENANLKLSDIDYFVCTNGPGSFTGLRIGIATMKALAQSMNKKMVEVSVLDGLIENIRNDGNILCSMIDARREEVYATVYKNNEKVLKDTPISLIELCNFLKNSDEKVIVNGDGAEAYRERICELMGDRVIFASPKKMFQNAVSVGMVGLRKIQNNEAVSYHDFRAEYLKVSQPEQNLNIKVR